MSNTELFNFLNNNISQYTLGEMIINLSVIAVVSIFIFLIYKLTTRKVRFYSNFALVIIITAIVTGVIMVVIESNLALSLGLVGALSIIRFRSAIKDPVDTVFIFWAVAVGLSSGTGNHVLTIAASTFIAFVVVVFSFFSISNTKQMLIIRGNNINLDEIKNILTLDKVVHQLKSVSKNEIYTEAIFEIKTSKFESVLNSLDSMENLTSVDIVSGVNV